ncbi:hypothetical protein [Microvirga sp. TS319]|uniref:hypothetical protein n=1 Tax=Microvirga sp. TS319 TaxID=3241165 RepID=UPI00351A9637
MTIIAPQALAWARSRLLRTIWTKFDEGPVLCATVIFVALAIFDMILGTSIAWVFLMITVGAAVLSYVSARLRRTPMQKRLADLATHPLQLFVTIAEIRVEPPLVEKPGSLVLMVGRRSRQRAEIAGKSDGQILDLLFDLMGFCKAQDLDFAAIIADLRAERPMINQ